MLGIACTEHAEAYDAGSGKSSPTRTRKDAHEDERKRCDRGAWRGESIVRRVPSRST